MKPFGRSYCVPYNGDGPTCSAADERTSMNRQRVTPQRYAARRLVVTVVLALGVFGAVKGVSSLNGNEASGEGPPNSMATGGAASSGSAGRSTDTIATTASVLAATPPSPLTTEPERTGPPTADSPAAVLIIGDSDAGTFGPYLERVVDEWGVVDVELDYKVSSGLARPDFFDWPAHLRRTLTSSDPDIIVVTFGGNDAQGLTEVNGSVVAGMPNQDTDDWTAEYVERVNVMMDMMLEDPERTVIWVGIPNADEEEFTGRLRIQDQAVRQALEAYPDAIFVDTWSIFDGVNGGIAELVVDPRDGAAKPVRAGDGFHLNEDGAEILAIAISEKLSVALEAMGAEF